MDISLLIYKLLQQSSTTSTFQNNPFPHRPWLTDTGVAAAVAKGGVKGIVAGIYITYILFFYIFCINNFNNSLMQLIFLFK